MLCQDRLTSAVNIEKQNKQQRELLTRTIDDSFKKIWFSVSGEMCKLSYVLVWSVCGAFGWWTVALQRCSPCPRVARSSRACAVPRPSAQRGACSHCVHAQQRENTKALKTILPNFSHKKQYLCSWYMYMYTQGCEYIHSRFPHQDQVTLTSSSRQKLLLDFTPISRCNRCPDEISRWRLYCHEIIIMWTKSYSTCSDTYRTTFCLFSLT